ncbi:MAG: hypothetical protein JWP57_103, partial [Spirosoma sp.]|nr:hypothetical protein [Spirosoma sp.]
GGVGLLLSYLALKPYRQAIYHKERLAQITTAE